MSAELRGTDIDSYSLVLVDPASNSASAAVIGETTGYNYTELPAHMNGTLQGECGSIACLCVTRRVCLMRPYRRYTWCMWSVLSPHFVLPFTSSYLSSGGFRGFYPNLDVTLILQAMAAMGKGTVTLRDFVAYNLPPSRVDYPLGLITALPWFAGLKRCALQRCVDGGPPCRIGSLNDFN